MRAGEFSADATPTEQSAFAGTVTIMAQKTQLDVHQISSVNLGIYRAQFDRIVELGGIRIQPTDETGCIWKFAHPDSGERGRLLHVEGYLGGNGVVMSGRGMAYLITRQRFALALAFPSAPRTMWLTDANHKKLPRDDESLLPGGWPQEMIKSVIRLRFRKILIIDEAYLLRQIGLRSPDGLQ